MNDTDQTEDMKDPRAHRRAIEDKYHQKVIQAKKYYCESCSIAYMSITKLNNHFNGMIHNPERYVMYDCDKCNYHSRQKYLYNRHLSSKKHINNYC